MAMSDESKKWPLVSSVIINYNGREFLQRCLSSVLSSDYPNFEIILIDNGSTDDSVELVKKLCENDSRVKLILNDINLGPSIGRNIGSKESKGKYLAFLDNDTEVSPRWLKEAVKVMESEPTIGASQCKLLLMDQRDRFDYAGDYLSQYGFLVQRVSMGEIDNGQFDRITEIFSAKSAGMVIRADVFRGIGLFDEANFIYMEETDLCWRVWLSGYRVVFIPTSIVHHAFGRISKLKSQHVKFLAKYHGTKNYIATLMKNLSPLNMIRILPVHLGMWFGIMMWHILRGRIVEATWIMQGILWDLKELKPIWRKRQIVQCQVRKVSHSYIEPRIMRNVPFTYFYNKAISDQKSGWRV